MKNKYIALILIFNYCFGNYVFSKQNETLSTSLTIGLSNQFFTYNNEGFSTISPTIGVQFLKHFYLLSQYERFRYQEIEDISNVRDGWPRVLSLDNIYQHIPITLKYYFKDYPKIAYYLKLSGINQFIKNKTTIYSYNKPTTENLQSTYNMLYGISAGFDFKVCDKNKIGLEAYFKNGKNVYSAYFGLSLTYMFNLNIKHHEK
jgi:hypothetical protein